ncbi:hypothetical protein NQ318_004531 [Aromia moschata]|uniref:DDE-1 domain-containing protein n=1 Tax=Aromia moschata TaxID=1265417 RepID=A0AAV8X082_9CUCU|nr:hypothetical protein NQ318_004531 [Aromia moschata]
MCSLSAYSENTSLQCHRSRNTKKKKTNRQAWSEEQVASAIALVESRQCGYMKAAKDSGVPKSTLERRAWVTEKNTFPPELERQLVTYVRNMESIAKNKTAGWTWLRSFMQRNNLSLRIPEATSAAKATTFNKNNVNNFFNLLESVQDRIHFSESQIYNAVETWITTVQGRQSKIIALHGRKQVGCLTSAERGTLSTAIICLSAAGTFIPPMIIFPRLLPSHLQSEEQQSQKNMNEQLMIGAPPGSVGVAHPSGWVQMNIFTKWFQHFVEKVNPSEDSPVLLILDGHYSHVRNIDVIDFALSNHVTVVSLPPHCSHMLQPLDKTFKGPLKTNYSEEIRQCLLYSDSPLSPYGMMELFGKAYLKVQT